MTETKPFNFNKWFNIWLVIINGLHLLSLISSVLYIAVLSSTYQSILDVPTSSSSSTAMVLEIGAATYERFVAMAPQLMLLVIIGHVISAIIFVLIAYFILRILAKNP